LPDMRRPSGDADQSERSRVRKKGLRPKQPSLALEPGDADQPVDQKKKRKGGGKVIVVGGHDGDIGEDGK
jgi:hypothetical protein